MNAIHSFVREFLTLWDPVLRSDCGFFFSIQSTAYSDLSQNLLTQLQTTAARNFDNPRTLGNGDVRRRAKLLWIWYRPLWVATVVVVVVVNNDVMSRFCSWLALAVMATDWSTANEINDSNFLKLPATVNAYEFDKSARFISGIWICFIHSVLAHTTN